MDVKRKGISTSGTIVLFVVGLLIGVGVMYVVAPSVISPSTVTTGGGVSTVTTTQTAAASGICNGGTATIGDLTDESGALKAQGIGQAKAVQMAISDINAYVAKGSCHLTFKVATEDYGHDPSKALSSIQALNTQGVTVVVGPLDSDSLKAIYSYASSNHIVIISPSSTAASLSSLPYLFRTVPTDVYQGEADTAEFLSLGIQDIIVINFVSAYAGGLANSTISDFKAAGGHVQDQIQYQITQTDFTAVLNKMVSDWNAAISTYPASKVAIYAVSEEELGTLLAQANASATFRPLLHTPQPWFGTDGESQDTVLSTGTTGALMAQIRLPSSVFNAPSNLKGANFSAAYQAATGSAPTVYQTGSYDDTWLAALSILDGQSTDGASINTLLRSVAANYFGVSGWAVMGSTNSALPDPGYQIWEVQNCATLSSCPGAVGTPPHVWVQVGFWTFATQKVTSPSGGTYSP
jgi:branched-chain amino acid transport system substrate-binding protein